MKPQTYTRFAKAVAWYMQLEHATAWAAVSQSEQASSAAAAVALASFKEGRSVPHTAGDIAHAVEQLTGQ